MSSAIFRQLNRLQIQASKELSGSRTGARSSHRRKPSTEFIEHRSYTAGDDIRYVDWRASARQDGVIIRQGELTKSVNIFILLDCSGSMHWGAPPKSVLQKKLASMLSYLALDYGDRLYLQPYGGRGNKALGPISGKGQFNSTARYLDQLNYSGEASLGQALTKLRTSVMNGGIVFILSDLLEADRLSEILGGLPTPAWMVNVVHLLHPQELAPVIRGSIELEDVETHKKVNFDLTARALAKYHQRVSDWQKRLDMACVEHHVSYTLVNTNASLEGEVLPNLRAKNILVNR
ncbi:MAG: DUF58 domain-containing protein [Chloroflexota bacterium]